MTEWIFIDTGENTGRFNMDFDLRLCEYIQSVQKPILRFYQWKPYAISLGYHQKLDSINLELAQKNNIDVVVRPTGGRAILHAEELTYSVIFPLNIYSPHQLYQKISQAIIQGFHFYDERLNVVSLEKSQIDFKEFYKSTKSIPCFSSSARNEIKYGTKKLVGSAQRVLNNSILQHGSILFGEYHKRIVDYLNLSDEEKLAMKNDLNEKTISLSELLNEEINILRIKESIRHGFEVVFEVAFEELKIEVANELNQ